MVLLVSGERVGKNGFAECERVEQSSALNELSCCEWSYDSENDKWVTTCGEIWPFLNGEMKFCFNCGEEIKEKKTYTTIEVTWPKGRKDMEESKETPTTAKEQSADPFGSSAATGYKFGQHVCFVDENQCEVRGIIKEKTDYPHFLELQIKLDDNGGWYYAKLLKR